MIQLPFFEDLHLLSFPPLMGKKLTPNEEQLKAVDQLIDSMDLMTAARLLILNYGPVSRYSWIIITLK